MKLRMTRAIKNMMSPLFYITTSNGDGKLIWRGAGREWIESDHKIVYGSLDSGKIYGYILKHRKGYFPVAYVSLCSFLVGRNWKHYTYSVLSFPRISILSEAEQDDLEYAKQELLDMLGFDE